MVNVVIVNNVLPILTIVVPTMATLAIGGLLCIILRQFHAQLNSRMDEFLALKHKSGIAEGVKEEKDRSAAARKA